MWGPVAVATARRPSSGRGASSHDPKAREQLVDYKRNDLDGLVFVAGALCRLVGGPATTVGDEACHYD
jgi:hypothetical protein